MTGKSRGADEWTPARVTRKGPLIISLHIPKTAGSRFGETLRRRYGKRLAFYYGKANPKTHPLLRVPPRQLTAERLDELAASGVSILHGHLSADVMLKAVPDPARYWTVMREPVETAISLYHFVRAGRGGDPKLRAAFDAAEPTLAEFVTMERIANHQSRYLGALPLERIGFLGVTELMGDMLPMVGLKTSRHRGNINREKPLASLAEREAVAAAMTADCARYGLAMELAMRRLGRRGR
ncbi:hypothetical protein [Acuticoccus yangtzensis]|uniref:hypothetical protein n=1 Tax=Acuticoccus yangtzensis TaxID=1443441 RepID=UPI0009495782|nr:hypothetical protein [Acuticoccus yangtzensis]